MRSSEHGLRGTSWLVVRCGQRKCEESDETLLLQPVQNRLQLLAYGDIVVDLRLQRLEDGRVDHAVGAGSHLEGDGMGGYAMGGQYDGLKTSRDEQKASTNGYGLALVCDLHMLALVLLLVSFYSSLYILLTLRVGLRASSPHNNISTHRISKRARSASIYVDHCNLYVRRPSPVHPRLSLLQTIDRSRCLDEKNSTHSSRRPAAV